MTRCGGVVTSKERKDRELTWNSGVQCEKVLGKYRFGLSRVGSLVGIWLGLLREHVLHCGRGRNRM